MIENDKIVWSRPVAAHQLVRCPHCGKPATAYWFAGSHHAYLRCTTFNCMAYCSLEMFHHSVEMDLAQMPYEEEGAE